MAPSARLLSLSIGPQMRFPRGRKELFHSNSEFTEEQPRNWKLNIYLGTNVLLP